MTDPDDLNLRLHNGKRIALTHRDLASPQPPHTEASERRWPFAETPGEFATRLTKAMREFDGDMLAACRNVLIENPPALAARAPQAAPASEKPCITLTASQLREALLFAAGDGGPLDEDQRETEVTIAWSDVTRDDDGKLMPPGYVAWLTEYPEEGCYLLDDETPQAAPAPQPEEKKP